jgi:enoyl-CoA hydratase
LKGYKGKWLSEPDHILFTTDGAVATVTLNVPEKRNALGNEMLAEMRLAMLEADDRTDINVIILCGAGKDFCAGYDLVGSYSGRGELTETGGYSYRESTKRYDDDTWSMERMQEATLAVFGIHKPVIAKIHGNCLAGGTDLAFACDLIVVADDARLGYPATRANGSPPSHMWIYHMGPQWAKRMLFTGDKLTGLDAETLGLALESWPADELDDAVMALAQRIAHTDPELLSAHKRIVNLALEQMGTLTLQRLASENDARAHLSSGPRRSRFKADMKENDLKAALKHRDEPFGDGFVRLRRSR